MKKIYSIVNTFIAQKNILDNKSIIDVINILIEKYDIENYLESISFNNDVNIAAYSPSEKMILINRVSELDYINEMYEGSRVLDQNLDYWYFYLFMQLVILFHEIEHAIQARLVNQVMVNKKVDVFREVMMDCENHFNRCYHDYQSYGSLFPIEKDANVFGYSKALDIFLNNRYISRELSIILGQLCGTIFFRGYSNYFENNDLERFYIDILRQENRYHQLLKFGRSLTLKEKICLNFPLNNADIKKCNALIHFIYSTVNNESDSKMRHVLKKKLML